MNVSVHDAAARLFGQLRAPPGSVNTLAGSDGRGPLIRVLVDPAYWSQIEALPRTFEGFRVRMEKRPSSVPFH